MSNKRELRNGNFENHNTVYISNEINLIKDRQRSCGGFSETNMKDILGSIGVVKCVKKNCITVEVNGRQFDLHPDLLSKTPQTNSLPAQNIQSIINPIICRSLPDPPIEENFFTIPDPPKDDPINSNNNSIGPNPIYQKYVVDTTSLMEAPLDKEDTLEITFDKSQIKNLNEVMTTESQISQTMDSTLQISQTMDSNLQTIPIDSRITNELSQTMDSNLQTIPLPPETSTEETSGYSAPKQIRCLKCCYSVINYALPCGHCYCTNCHNSLDNCIKCNKICQGWIKIHLQI